MQAAVSLIVFGLICIPAVQGIWCYFCHNSQPGCGDKVDWLLQGQKARWCEDFCVKMEDRSGETRHVLRDCLTNLMDLTEYRHDIPSLRRHGYCLPSKNSEPSGSPDKYKQYCFCNDWNYCNHANSRLPVATTTMTLCSLLVTCLTFFHAA